MLGLLLATLMDAVGKSLSSQISVIEVSSSRFFFHFLLITPFILFFHFRQSSKKKFTFQIKPMALHCMRGCLLSGASFSFFFAIQDNPIPDTLTIFFVEPLFVALLASYFLGEKMSKQLIMAILLGFCGVVIVLRPGFDNDYEWTIIFALLAGFLFAGYIVSARFSSLNTTATITSWATAGFAFIPMLPFLFVKLSDVGEINWSDEIIWQLVLLGGLSASAHTLIILSCRYLAATKIALIHYSEIVFAVIVNWFLFAHFPDLWVWVGVMVIVLANLMIIPFKKAK